MGNEEPNPPRYRLKRLQRGPVHALVASAKHEILQEQDRYRAQFRAAFYAFVPRPPRY